MITTVKNDDTIEILIRSSSPNGMLSDFNGSLTEIIATCMHYHKAVVNVHSDVEMDVISYNSVMFFVRELFSRGVSVTLIENSIAYEINDLILPP